MRSKIQNIKELIGNTPMIRLSRIEKYFGINCEIYAKLEMFNPTHSVKDRAALYILEDAYQNGKIREGSVIVEATSGNMGISLSALSTFYGCTTVIFMPENMSRERVRIIEAYGGRLILTPADEGMNGARSRAEKYATELGAFIPRQFENPMNRTAHYVTTGPEIYRQTNGRIGVFVAGVGTGGTITGVGGYLKKQNDRVKNVAVEPRESAVLTGEKPNKHRIQGIGAGFYPPLIKENNVVDEIATANYEQSAEYAGILSKKEGIFAGISSGAALYAAVKLSKEKYKNKENIVVLLPDGGEKYMSI